MQEPHEERARKDAAIAALRQLKARYPYMFEGSHLGRTYYRGWLPGLINAAEQIDRLLGEEKRGFHFRQIKEKHGWVRYYWRTDAVVPFRLSLRTGDGILERSFGLEDAGEVENRISEILFKAEQESMQQCILCGASATNQLIDGWNLAVCDVHGRGNLPRSDLVRVARLEDPER